MATSSQTGMGARIFNGGVGFRVWAPNAHSVSVVGDFNGWSNGSNPLSSESNGYWSTDVFGATIGQQYKYVINGNWKNDPYARELSIHPQNTIIHDPDFDWEGDSFTIPNWNELVIYELHIGTFNSPGDGRFSEVIDKMGYLQDLGINAIEVMAVGEFNTDHSWGYNTAFPFAIETDYGGIHEFKRFVKVAHQHGIAIIFDVVYNHFGPNGLDIWQFDGWQMNGKGGIYFYNDHRSPTPWGDTRPDYGRGEVRQYIRDNALMWIEKRHVDGLRWDATRFIHTINGVYSQDIINQGWGLMQWINNEVKARFPGTICIAEDMHFNPAITTNSYFGGAGFDSQWDSLFVNAVRDVIINSSDEGRDFHKLKEALTFRYNESAFSRIIYSESHDEVAGHKMRVPEAITPSNAGSWYAKKRSTIGAVLTFTAPGIPMIFQGQEFLEHNSFSDTTSLDWSKTLHFSGIRNLYRDLIRLRRNWFDTTRGLRGQHINVFHVNHSDKVMAYHRWENGGRRDDVIVVINLSIKSFSSYTIGFPQAGRWKLRFNSDWSGYSSDFSNHGSFDIDTFDEGKDYLPYGGNISVGSYSTIIYSQD